ncbi:ABC transporter ATP-binding protein [Thermodesulforhabdus norvegica]|uniref:Amino acid/amide ABC transporter ATP-binding protein 1, HAAT family (TC 3.A.1.4.-) n=1 Tax=Thermodesulforhabdus norvegica TaxID=39841 RepID=A0A1I4UBE5_9BACT|nr:ABC transporter ATP-binding protein [Thermodesulforhabdus norvegica]SFM86292.1 amino acid/amide ABC transporter ATP-binding protein 1, HAAT family (TC 3.A.1.4.-) [Thermodesulforhabdus norvegica]
MNGGNSVFFEARELTMRFGGLVAVNNFSLTLKGGELMGLIGPNGAGKTTVFNMITGMLVPTSGRIIWQDEDITGYPPYRITAKGIARTFQNIRLFNDLTVIDNVMVSYHHRLRSSFWHAILGLRKYRAEEEQMREEAMEILREVGLAHLAGEKAGALPYGQQRRLEIARALATSPKLLLLDEPAAGMNPQETMELAQFVRKIRDRFNLTIFLIEHDMKFVMGLCERIKVLDYGNTIAEGTPEEIQNNPEVIKAYLGEPKHAARR